MVVDFTIEVYNECIFRSVDVTGIRLTGQSCTAGGAASAECYFGLNCASCPESTGADTEVCQGGATVFEDRKYW